jgi:hypothetical protein
MLLNNAILTLTHHLFGPFKAAAYLREHHGRQFQLH